jgi:hypothetical protein
MKKNMGLIDRIIRVLIAVTVVILYYFGILSGTWTIVLLALSGIFILTSIFGICPLYMPFGIKTCKKKTE